MTICGSEATQADFELFDRAARGEFTKLDHDVLEMMDINYHFAQDLQEKSNGFEKSCVTSKDVAYSIAKIPTVKAMVQVLNISSVNYVGKMDHVKTSQTGTDINIPQSNYKEKPEIIGRVFQEIGKTYYLSDQSTLSFRARWEGVYNKLPELQTLGKSESFGKYFAQHSNALMAKRNGNPEPLKEFAEEYPRQFNFFSKEEAYVEHKDLVDSKTGQTEQTSAILSATIIDKPTTRLLGESFKDANKDVRPIPDALEVAGKPTDKDVSKLVEYIKTADLESIVVPLDRDDLPNCFLQGFRRFGETMQDKMKDYPKEFPELKSLTFVSPSILNLSLWSATKSNAVTIWGDQTNWHHVDQKTSSLMLTGGQQHKGAYSILHVEGVALPEADRKEYLKEIKPNLGGHMVNQFLGEYAKHSEVEHALKSRAEEAKVLAASITKETKDAYDQRKAEMLQKGKDEAKDLLGKAK